MIDTSTLTEVLSVDTVRQVAVVEPNVPMDKLVHATLRDGLMPLVVPEFPGITVGGAIQGGAGESSSFKYGFFSQTVNWVEYIVGDGTIITASAEKIVTCSMALPDHVAASASSLPSRFV
jgi:FAD/FMN-containing dehydrogenase